MQETLTLFFFLNTRRLNYSELSKTSDKTGSFFLRQITLKAKKLCPFNTDKKWILILHQCTSDVKMNLIKFVFILSSLLYIQIPFPYIFSNLWLPFNFFFSTNSANHFTVGLNYFHNFKNLQSLYRNKIMQGICYRIIINLLLEDSIIVCALYEMNINSFYVI